MKDEIKPFKFDYEKHKTYMITLVNGITSHHSGNNPHFLEYGLYRKSKINADYSINRIKQSNLLEALVEQFQEELGGCYYIYKFKDIYLFKSNHEEFIPGVVYMKHDTAEKICDMLNNNEFSLNWKLDELF